MRLMLASGFVLGCLATTALAGKGTSLEDLLVHSRDALVRESAAQVLGQRGSTTAIPLLVDRLAHDDNLWVRARAAEALGVMGAADGVGELRAALGREKDQRVRRMIAEALVRVGQREGVDELMWQLRAGTNNTKAEAMAFLVGSSSRPLGQDVQAWWSYLAAEGYQLLARRAAGSPALFEVRGLVGSGAPREGPLLRTPAAQPWRRVPAVVLRLPPRLEALTPERLQAYEREQGAIPDGCLLLVRGGWREAKPVAPAPPQPRSRSLRAAPPPPPPGPGLTAAAVRYLLARAPKLLGVGVDAPALDAPAERQAGSPGVRLLLANKRLVLESLDDLERLPSNGVQLVLVEQGLPDASGARRVLVLALLP